MEDLNALQQAYRGDQPRLVDGKRAVEVATISTELESKSPEVWLTAPQLAQQLGIGQDHLWLWIRRKVVVLASEPEIAKSPN